jgi:hypothetical protein
MLTIVQASATFVAIIAGFFTTKIISISNDRKKLENKLVECNIQLQGRRNILSEYEGTIEGIYEKWGQEEIVSFVSDMLKEIDLHLYTVDELESRFHEKYLNPSEQHLRILRERYDEIVEHIKTELKTRTEEYKQDPFRRSVILRHSIPRYYDKDLLDKEVETRDRTEEKIQTESNEISILETLNINTQRN